MPGRGRHAASHRGQPGHLQQGKQEAETDGLNRFHNRIMTGMADITNHSLSQLGQLLTAGLFVGSAARILAIYLSASLRKSFLQPEQHSFTSWPL